MEIFDIVDENGEPTGETVSREKAHAEGILHRTSHLWIFRKREGRVQILLQKRCDGKDSFPGCYDISSAGHIPAGCGYKESAIRELKEELGTDISEEELILCGSRMIAWDDNFHGKPYHDRQFSNVFICWIDKEETEFSLQAEEVESVKWFDLEECVRMVKENSFKHCIEMEEFMMVYEAAKK